MNTQKWTNRIRPVQTIPLPEDFEDIQDDLGISKPHFSVPAKRSFVEKLTQQRTDLCHYVRGTDSTGRDAYYFVRIFPARKAQFLKHKVGDTYNIKDYGEIVYSAYGTTVPDDVKEMLRKKYGFENFGD